MRRPLARVSRRPRPSPRIASSKPPPLPLFRALVLLLSRPASSEAPAPSPSPSRRRLPCRRPASLFGSGRALPVASCLADPPLLAPAIPFLALLLQPPPCHGHRRVPPGPVEHVRENQVRRLPWLRSRPVTLRFGKTVSDFRQVPLPSPLKTQSTPQRTRQDPHARLRPAMRQVHLPTTLERVKYHYRQVPLRTTKSLYENVV